VPTASLVLTRGAPWLNPPYRRPAIRRNLSAGLLCSIFKGETPPLIVGKEHRGPRSKRIASHATLLSPSGDHIFRSQILFGRLPHDCWRAQPVALPSQTTLNRPLKDSSPFFAQALWQFEVTLSYRDKPPRIGSGAADAGSLRA
jgi:hypothetical protein